MDVTGMRLGVARKIAVSAIAWAAFALPAAGAIGQEAEDRVLERLREAVGPGLADRAPEVVERLRRAGATVIGLGRKGALDGWAVSPAGKEPYALYVDDTGHAVMGILVGPDGVELTRAQVRAAPGGSALLSGGGGEPSSQSAAAGRPGAGTACPAGGGAGRAPAVERVRSSEREGFAIGGELVDAAVFRVVEQAVGFVLGERGPLVVTFADPGCPASRAAVAQLAEKALAGELRLKVLPVGVLGAESEQGAAAVLSREAKDRALNWFGGQDGAGARTTERGVGLAGLNRRVFGIVGPDFVPWSLRLSGDGSALGLIGADFSGWFGE